MKRPPHHLWRTIFLGVGMFLQSQVAGNLFGEEEGSPFPNRDEFAGKSVSDAQHAGSMVNLRLFNAPQIGEKAPPAELIEGLTGKIFNLSELHSKKPLVLFFASYSCNCAQESAHPVKVVSERYENLCNFALIYIREAHPLGGFKNPVRGEKYDIPEPRNFPERALKALQFAEEKKFQFPVFVDSMDDPLAVRWGAWPIRLFVIDQTGTVIFAGQQGPWFHKPTRDFDPMLENVPAELGKIPGYSQGSLEEFLEDLSKKSPPAINR